jgi:hypothetical protein
MNKLSIKRLGTLMGALFLISTVSFSQFDNFDFLKSSPADGVKFLQSYISPYANAFSAGLSGGWYNTARPHKILGFDLTVSVNAGIVPSSDNTFDVKKIGLSTAFAPTSASGPSLTPTVAGPESPVVPMTVKDASGNTLMSFNTPPGVNWKYVPAPTAQIGLGLPFGTELKFRFLPKVNIGDGDVSLWGVGVMHSLIQYLPGAKMIKLFDVSAFGGYTKISSNIPLNLKPDQATSHYSAAVNPTTAFNNQFLSATVSALNIGIIGSVSIPVITVYGGLGYSKTGMDIKLKGNFPTPTFNAAYLPTPSVYEDKGIVGDGITGVTGIKPFPAIEIKNLSGLRANIGLRIKLAILTIHADYTLAQYNILSAGIGLSIR